MKVNFKNKLSFKHRTELAKQYRDWLHSKEAKLDKPILMGPESFLVFLQSKGYLNEEKIINDYENTTIFSRKELEGWLYEICLNNEGSLYGEHIKDLIDRLDGFENYCWEHKED